MYNICVCPEGNVFEMQKKGVIPVAKSKNTEAKFSSGQWQSSADDTVVEASPLLDGATKVRTPLNRKKTYRKQEEEAVKQLKPGKTTRNKPATASKKPGSAKTKPAAAKPAPKKPAKKRSIFSKIYRFCYYVGIQVMRMALRLRRRARGFWASLKSWRIQRSSNRSFLRQRRRSRILHHFTLPFREMVVRYRALTAAYQEKHNCRPSGLANAWLILSSGRPVAAMAANYIMPVAALVFLLVTIHHYSTMTLGLAVEYEGQTLGVISNENVFTQAQISMKERIVSDTNASKENIVPTYTLTAAGQEDITDVETLTNRMITASGGILEEAAGFYLDGRFIGAVENGDKLLDYLVNVLARSETDAEDETISFIKAMSLKEGLYPTSQVMPLHKLVEKISGDQQVKKVYVIEPGDTPTGVASKNNMPYSELKALNPDIEKVSFFQVGNEVLISRPESYLATKVTRTEVYEEDIAFGVDSIPDDRYPQGYTVVVSAGIPGKQTVTANVTYIDGIEESRLVTKTIVTKEPVNKVVRVGTMTPQQYVAGLDQSGSGFIWPVDWGYFNGSLGSYWGHTGMDIAGNYGAPVRASRSGTVVRSAWYGPYGMHVIIDHGNGVTTLYAHMSEKYAVVGQYVVQGEMIGKVGRTGNVTGPHLHFEVRINGAYQDPIRYIGTYKKTR